VRWRSETGLPFARLELVHSRAAWLGEPLPAAAIGWATVLTSAVLPERQAFPALYSALAGLLDAVCHAPSARGWLPGLTGYEALIQRELGYGGKAREPAGDHAGELARFDAQGARIARYLLADRRGNVMAARTLLREWLGRIE